MSGLVWRLPLVHLERRQARPRIFTDSRGALSLPLALMLMSTTFAAFGTWGLMHHWNNLTALQLRLDRCVGEAALDLRATLKRIEFENVSLRALRAAQALADIEAPGSLVPEITALAEAQDAEIFRWKARQAAWMLAHGCDGQPDLPSPLPSMGWDPRLPPDTDGPQALVWSGSEKRLVFQLNHPPRAAAAVVQARRDQGLAVVAEGVLGATNWKASWTVPGVFGARSVRTNVN